MQHNLLSLDNRQSHRELHSPLDPCLRFCECFYLYLLPRKLRLSFLAVRWREDVQELP